LLKLPRLDPDTRPPFVGNTKSVASILLAVIVFADILPPSITVVPDEPRSDASSGVIVNLLADIVPVCKLPPCIDVDPFVDKSDPIIKPPAVIKPVTSICAASSCPVTIESASISTAFTKSAVRDPILAASIDPFLMFAVSINTVPPSTINGVTEPVPDEGTIANLSAWNTTLLVC
jgi:hypothetical protein